MQMTSQVERKAQKQIADGDRKGTPFNEPLFFTSQIFLADSPKIMQFQISLV